MSAEGRVVRIAEKWTEKFVQEDADVNYVVESAIREALLEMSPYLGHLAGCGGYFSADSLSMRKWVGSEHKWRDCTCGLADKLREAAREEAERG